MVQSPRTLNLGTLKALNPKGWGLGFGVPEPQLFGALSLSEVWFSQGPVQGRRPSVAKQAKHPERVLFFVEEVYP